MAMAVLARSLSLERANARAKLLRCEALTPERISISHRLSQSIDALYVLSCIRDGLSPVEAFVTEDDGGDGDDDGGDGHSMFDLLDITSPAVLHAHHQIEQTSVPGKRKVEDGSLDSLMSALSTMKLASPSVARDSMLAMDGYAEWDHEFSSMSSCTRPEYEISRDMLRCFRSSPRENYIDTDIGRDAFMHPQLHYLNFALDRAGFFAGGCHGRLDCRTDRMHRSCHGGGGAHRSKWRHECGASSPLTDDDSNDTCHGSLHCNAHIGTCHSQVAAKSSCEKDQEPIFCSRCSYSDYREILLTGSVAIEKLTMDPCGDFRESILEMMMMMRLMWGRVSSADLEEEGRMMQHLLHCYLELNSHEVHEIITQTFNEVWREFLADRR